MSFGIASRNGREISAEELLHRADLATFDAKQDGRNCIRVYGSRVYEPSATLSMNKNHLQRAGEVRPVSEPIQEAIDSLGQEDEPDLKQSPAVEPKVKQPDPANSPSRPWLIKLYVGALVFMALTLIALFVRPEENYDWIGLVAFTLLVILVEALAVEIYVKETSVSTSVAPLLAGVLLFGPLAAVVLGLGVALVAFFRQRSQLDRLLFNSSNKR